MKKIFYVIIFICIELIIFNPECTSKQDGWVVADSFVVKDDNSQFPYETPFVKIACLDTLNCIAFANIAYTMPFNRITTDGGKTWFTNLSDSSDIIIKDTGDTEIIYTHTNVFDMAYPNKDLCIATCDSGYYWLSNDIFSNWKKYKFDTSYYYTDFFDSNLGIVLSDDKLLITKDACKSWLPISVTIPFPDSLMPYRFYDVEIPESETIFLLCYDKNYDRFIIKSTDLGISWHNFHRFEEFVDKLYFINESIGFVSGAPDINNYTRKDLLYKTTDGGDSWRAVIDTIIPPKWGLTDVSFCDEMNGIAFGYRRNIWRTTDGGETWDFDSSFVNIYGHGFAIDMSYPSKNTLFACTNNQCIFKWTANSSGIVEDISVSESEDMWISPNPVIEDYNIEFFLDNPSEVEMFVYNTNGDLKQKIIAGYRLHGMNSVTIPSAKLSNGVYFVIIKTRYNQLKGKFVKLN